MGLRRGLGVAVAAVLVAGLVAAGRAEHRSAPVAAVDAAAAFDPAGEVDLDRLRLSLGLVTGPASGPATGSSAPPPADVRLRTHRTCGDLLDHLRDEALQLVTPWGLPGSHAIDVMPGMADGGGAAGPTSGGQASGGSGAAGRASGDSGGGATGFSTTNVQEAGVDEPDLVKNDDRRAFTLFGGTLRSIVLDGAGSPRVAGTVDVVPRGGTEHGLLLVGDRIVVLAGRWQHGGPGTPATERTQLTVVDVGDPARPTVIRQVEVDGGYVSARASAGTIRVVVSSTASLAFAYPNDDNDSARQAALDANRDVIGSSTLSDWLPALREGAAATALHTGCATVHTTPAPSGFGTTSVLTVDPGEAAVVDSVSVVADGREVYASAGNLYVATSALFHGLAGRGGGGAARAADRTEVHQFDISDPRRTSYVASGAVAGHLLRPFFGGGGDHLAQWALSEHAGHLRVATTLGRGAASESLVTVVRTVGDVLVPVGVVAGLGRGERIYAVRFAGDRGYVVTYREIDPLYVLDLSDPAAPRALGELKVPGYSAYLHPVGPGLLLGVGQDDPNEEGLAHGTQVSLFDVSDPAAPRRVGHLSLGGRGTISEAEADHRAFTWWPDPSRAVLPLDDWNGGFRGAVVVTLDGHRLAEVGRVTHPVAEGDGGGNDDGGNACAHLVRRSRVIGDALYTFSGAGVWTNALGDLAPRGSLRYSPQPPAPGCSPAPAPEPPPTTTTTTTTLLPVPGP